MQIAERLILQLPKIITQPKISSQVPVMQKPVMTEKSIKHVNHVDLVAIAKPITLEIVPNHVKQIPGTELIFTIPKHKISRQEMRQEKAANADPIYGFLQKLIASPTYIDLRETEASDIDSLEHDINVDFEEHFPIKV